MKRRVREDLEGRKALLPIDCRAVALGEVQSAHGSSLNADLYRWLRVHAVDRSMDDGLPVRPDRASPSSRMGGGTTRGLSFRRQSRRPAGRHPARHTLHQRPPDFHSGDRVSAGAGLALVDHPLLARAVSVMRSGTAQAAPGPDDDGAATSDEACPSSSGASTAARLIWPSAPRRS